MAGALPTIITAVPSQCFVEGYKPFVIWDMIRVRMNSIGHYEIEEHLATLHNHHSIRLTMHIPDKDPEAANDC